MDGDGATAAHIKACCAAVYGSGLVHLLLGGRLHPGGDELTRRLADLTGIGLGDRVLDVASGPFFGFNRPGAKVSQGMIDWFWLQGMQAGHKNAFDCIKAFSETDLNEDLKKFNVPTLIIHGDDDQIVPIGASALLSSKIVKGSTLKIYPGAPHGLTDTHKDKLNAELLAFLKA